MSTGHLCIWNTAVCQGSRHQEMELVIYPCMRRSKNTGTFCKDVATL